MTPTSKKMTPTQVVCQHAVALPDLWIRGSNALAKPMADHPAAGKPDAPPLYHLASAFWKGQTHTDLRRLDQSMIHLAGSVFALALSRGFALYSATHLCHSLFCISRIKRFGRRNWIDAARSVFLWLLPMAGHWEFVTAAVLHTTGQQEVPARVGAHAVPPGCGHVSLCIYINSSSSIGKKCSSFISTQASTWAKCSKKRSVFLAVWKAKNHFLLAV